LKLANISAKKFQENFAIFGFLLIFNYF